jgi:hypothetical protein
VAHLLYCDVDENGNIVDAFGGLNIIPSRQYDFYFFLEDEINITDYRVNVEERTLVLK